MSTVLSTENRQKHAAFRASSAFAYPILRENMRFLCVQGLFAGACVPVSACPSPKATFQCVPKSARAFRPPVFVRPVLILAIYESKYTLHSYQAQNKAYLFLRGDPYRQTQRSKGPRCCKRRESKLSSLKLAMATDLARSPRWRPLSPVPVSAGKNPYWPTACEAA